MDRSDYFYWLCEMVCVDGRYNDTSYYRLAELLFQEEFYWVVDYDEDRADDGLEMRNRYRYEGGQEDPGSGTCSVFEMLVALADRMEQILDELDGECKTPIFFWQMIENLTLDRFSDEYFERLSESAQRSAEQRILKKLHKWMDRDIDYNGKGGIFPLRQPKRDQRDLDFWYQANAYILEEYWG